MSDQKIVDRIRKLLAMTGESGATDGEIRNAIGHAQRLMNDHHLTEADLAHEPADDYAKVDPDKFGQCRAWVGGRMYFWETELAWLIAKFVGVPMFLDHIRQIRINGILQLDEHHWPRKGRSVVFYGVAEDAAIASELFAEMRLTISTMATARWGGVLQAGRRGVCRGLRGGTGKTDRNREWASAH